MLERAENAAGVRSEARAQGGLYTLGGVLLAVALYSAAHIAARLIASGNLGEDDPLDAVLTQTLSWGYLPGQPPLYNWALWLMQQAMGPGVLHFQLLKYGLLMATCAFIFLAARRIMDGDAFWAFLSVEALALIYQISWRFHEGFTHAVGAMCAVAATFWLLIRVIDRGRMRDYAFLGVAIGLGLLTIMTFWVYLAALFAACCLQPSLRQKLLRREMAAAGVIAAAIAAPHFVWLASAPGGILSMLPEMASADATDHVRRALAGIRRAFTEPVMYLAPLIFLYPLFFPGMLRSVLRRARLWPNGAPSPDLEQLILHLTLFGVAALIAGALIFGIHRYPVHALMPLFLVTSIWLTAQARHSAPSEKLVRRFVIAALSVAVFAFFARAANMYVLQPVCSICRWGIPYEALAAEIKQTGFAAGRILTTDRELGGNLRRFFPDASIALVGSRTYAPPGWTAERRGGEIALLWPADEPQEKAAAKFRTLLPGLTSAVLARGRTLHIPWGPPHWLTQKTPVSSWRLIILDSAAMRALIGNEGRKILAHEYKYLSKINFYKASY